MGRRDDLPILRTREPRRGAVLQRLRRAAAAPAPAAGLRAYTPRHLAETILASKSALEGERKQVTVLFADVERSMELAERVDPEEWHRLLDRLFRILATASTATRGPSTSTPATASWRSSARRSPTRTTPSAPARPPSTSRAISGRSPRSAAREPARFRGADGPGLGEVVVGRIGDDLRMDYTAQGHRRPRRPGAAAGAAGRRHMTEHTARLARGSSISAIAGSRTSRVRACRCGCSTCGGRDPSGAAWTVHAPRGSRGSWAANRARDAREGPAQCPVRSPDGRPDHRGARRGKEPPVS